MLRKSMKLYSLIFSLSTLNLCHQKRSQLQLKSFQQTIFLVLKDINNVFDSVNKIQNETIFRAWEGLLLQLIAAMLILLFLIAQTQAITQLCNTTSSILPISTLPNSSAPCPPNSHCLSNSYCACDTGYVGGCSQKAYPMQDGSLVSATITSTNYTFFSVTHDINSYVVLIFEICHPTSSTNMESIDVWEDKGSIQILNKSNSLPGGKDWEIREGCLKLSTSLLLFNGQTNGQPQLYVLGIKLTHEGSLELSLQLEIDVIDFWDLFIKFMFIIGGIFLLVFALTIAVFIFKWRRRNRRAGRSSENDISHFNNFMPKYKLSEENRYRTHEQNCSVCLLELGDDDWLRKTVCKHVFHQECLDEWCKANLNCPICRRSFQLQDLAGDHLTKDSTHSDTQIRNPLLAQR